MKSVLIISSSPVKNGNSDTLCDKFLAGAIYAGNRAEKIFLKDKNINCCLSCGYCRNNDYNGCSQRDDMTEILDKMLAADVIVLASPVYFYTVCAQMKTFIDRLCAKYTKLSAKEFYFIVTAADSDEKMLERTVECFRGLLDCLDNSVERGTLYGAGVWKKGEVLSTNYPDMAYEMGKNI